jgi:hypothetical protein
MKRAFGLVVALCVLVGVLPAAAADGFVTSAAKEAEARAFLRDGAAPAEVSAASLRHQVRDQWYDECNDADRGARLDLRSTIAAQTGDQTGLLGYTCRAWATPDLGDGHMVWWLHTKEYDDGASQVRTKPNFAVVVLLDGGLLTFEVYRLLEDQAERDWRGSYLTWRGSAKRLDDHAVDVVFPTKAIGGADAFGFEWTVTDHAGRGDRFPEFRDLLPADDDDETGPLMELASFPRSCEGSEWQRLSVTPDDPGYTQQWALPAVRAPAAWSLARSSGIRVAVIDDGISGARRDLQGRVLAGYDIAHDYPLAAGRDSDRGGHGTAVAGVLGATGNNGTEIAGVDWGAQLMPVRVADVNQCISSESVAKGIRWAVDNGARVINVSLGMGEADGAEWTDPEVGDSEEDDAEPGPAPEPREPPLAAVRAAVDYAFSKNVMVVAGAGNDDGSVLYPAAYPAVLAVGALTRDGRRAPYSNIGHQLDVMAPGGDGSGTRDRDLLTLGEVGQLTPHSGTSFSAAMVSGAVALYRARYPHASVDDIRRAVQASARDLERPGHDTQTGYGLLDIERLLQLAPGPDLLGALARVADARPADVAISVSKRRFQPRAASHVVLARHDVFADALAGAALTRKGPLLFTARTVMPELTAAELQRVLPPGGTVYLLGGAKAVDPAVERAVTRSGFRVKRLHGADRYATAVAVGDEVRRLNPGVTTVALARARGRTATDTAAWADSVTGGAWAARAGVPVLITDSKALHPTVASALGRWKPQRTVLFGGEHALSRAVERAVPRPRRVFGADRAATAAAIGAQLWTEPRGFVFSNGYREDGWAFGLAAAGLAADMRAPLLIVNRDVVPDATRRHVAGCAVPTSGYTLVGSAAIIGGPVESALVKATKC